MKNDNIKVDNLIIGKNVIISDSAKIRGINGNAKRIVIGDNTYIGDNVQIICDDVEIGDYCKIHHHTNIHGYKPLKIGNNAWIGQYCIIDTIGGVTIGDNFGLGAHSQFWSHIKYGDTLNGCRFSSSKEVTIGNDVWFVGHCIVSPINAKDKSMALAGSVITNDMEENEIYAGVPAVSISNKVGNQFKEVSLSEKLEKMNLYLDEWGGDKSKISIVEKESDISDNEKTYFILSNRKYTKRLTESEIGFMNFLLPEKAKFTPL
jgi:acetyltransferase-like isoleucine patch superfamily enzyme